MHGRIDKPKRDEDASKKLFWVRPEKTVLKNRTGELLLLRGLLSSYAETGFVERWSAIARREKVFMSAASSLANPIRAGAHPWQRKAGNHQPHFLQDAYTLTLPG